MDVYLLRHGDAGDSARWAGDDSQRPLTEQGVARMKQQAATLRKWNLQIDALISSPYVRARQTANAIAEAFGVPVIEDARLQPGCTLKLALELLREQSKLNHIWLTGHGGDDSDLGGIASGLIGGGHLRIVKGGLLHIRITTLKPSAGELIWQLTPALMGAT